MTQPDRRSSSLRPYRMTLLLLVDATAWILAIYVAAGLRLETWRVSPTWRLSDAGGAIPLGGWLITATIAVTLYVALSTMLRMNQGRHAVAGFDETVLVVGLMLLVGGFLLLATVVGYPQAMLARSTPVIAAPIAVLLALVPRLLWRVWVVEPKRTRSSGGRRVVIVGAGPDARDLVRSMLRDDDTWVPVAFVEDSPTRKHFRYLGVPVAGVTADLLTAARRFDASFAIIAERSLDAAGVRRIYDLAVSGGLEVKVLPGISEMVEGGVTVRDVRDVRPTDLLGRQQVDTDVTAIAGYLSGKRVLVTGAGGSIGAELARQIAGYNPSELVLLDRDESALHAALLPIYGRADMDSDNVVLADIREPERLKQIFAKHRPQVVFHAAALKHVNVLENQPAEAYKTNVLGTAHVLAASGLAGVERFVNVSTDKAAAPQNVLGYTKRIAEGLTSAYARDNHGMYMSVRFGNVLGTRGSVLTTFTSQIRSGGPVTVTHPDVTRYFMTVNEAVQLVIQAAAIGRDGEALVLDMGAPVRIVEVAQRMIDYSRKDIAIEFTGLKPGEKMHEVLLNDGESDSRPWHPLVSHVPVGAIQPTDLASMNELCDVSSPALKQELSALCCRMGRAIGAPEGSV